MKCGTSSLHEYLGRHPQIGMSAVKELNYFAGSNCDKSLEWYKAHFDRSKPIRGESSQNYSKAHDPIYAGAPKRIHSIIPDARLIYLVRDPIERYRSHLVENYIGETKDSISHNISCDTYVKTGMYHYQLTFFLEFYPVERILVIDADDLRDDRLATMNRVFDFLGVTPLDDAALFGIEVNANGEDIVSPRISGSRPYRLLRRIAPSLVARVVATPSVRRRLFPRSYKAPLSELERTRLAEQFSPDVAALRALTGQRFARWQV